MISVLRIYLACMIYFVSLNTDAQQCTKPADRTIIHGNNIRTYTHTGGDLFWDRQNAQFKVPYRSESSPSTIFAAGLWLGALDETGSLRIATSTFPYSIRFDYAAGPLVGGATDPENCNRWDRHWIVFRNDILSHITDAENGTVDKHNPRIFSWPGHGNTYFEEYNGFPLPDDELLSAPFHDKNGDGKYQPDQGEYPLPENIDANAVPSQISWCVFNDAGVEHTASYGDPLNFEIQLTAYAYTCDDMPVLDNTLFTSYKLVNRSGVEMDSVIMGMWSDNDVGCYYDDYVGCIPEFDAFFAYNEDPVDGVSGTDTFCPSSSGPLPTYGNNPPMQSMTFLNQTMSAYMVTANDGVPLATTAPQLPHEVYNILSGVFRDGTPVTEGGFGFDTDGDTTTFMFPDSPLSTSGWSLYQEDLPFADRRSIASTNLGTIVPEKSVVIDLAWTFHSDTNLNNVTTYLLMQDELQVLKSTYAEGFASACAYSNESCDRDCVWPGDTNHDGVVNGIDYLTVLTNLNATGEQRTGTIRWQPLRANDWVSTTFYGTNSKHTDANGDGVISNADLSTIETNFGQSYREQNQKQEPRYGDNWVLNIENPIINVNNIFPPTRLDVKFTPQFNAPMTGITFQVKFDPDYFDQEIPVRIEYSSAFSDTSTFARAAVNDSSVIIVESLYDGKSQIPVANDLLEVTAFHSSPEITDGQDTAYIEIINARAALPSGEIIPIPGQRLPVIFVDSAPPIQQAAITTGNEFLIYPNPNSGQFTLEVSDKYIGRNYSIVDMQGRIIQAGAINNSRNRLELTAGVFIIKVETTEGPVSERVVVLE